MAIQDGFHCTD